MTQEAHINIVGGPGKFELMLGLFEGKVINFSLEGGKNILVHLLIVQKEDRSNESWNLEGFTNDSRFPGFHGFHAYYTTHGNHGTISLTV